MTEIEQAMSSLQLLVQCRCDEAYTGRDRHDPHSACDYADEVKIVVDHIKALEAKLAKAVDVIKHLINIAPEGDEDEWHIALDDAAEALAKIKGKTK